MLPSIISYESGFFGNRSRASIKIVKANVPSIELWRAPDNKIHSMLWMLPMFTLTFEVYFSTKGDEHPHWSQMLLIWLGVNHEKWNWTL